MRQAKAFLVMCAGILLLALSYHLGARMAGAQGGAIDAASVFYCQGDCTAAVVGRTFYLPMPDGTFTCGLKLIELQVIVL